MIQLIQYKGSITTLMYNQVKSIEKLILSGKKVFTAGDLAVLWEITDTNKLSERIKYYLKNKRLKSIHRGIYVYDNSYTKEDIAQKLFPLSYISLYTTSQIYGLTFQYYSDIYSIALKSKKYEIDGTIYIYHKVKESIFYNTIGLINNGRYTISSKERTICDMLYVFPKISFDNLREINIKKLEEISKIYDNKRLEKSIKNIIFEH